MKASDIIDTFHIFRETKVAIILGKNWEMMLMGWNKVLDPNFSRNIQVALYNICNTEA